MKKHILILLLTLLSFTLSGCGNSKTKNFSYSDKAFGTVKLCDYNNLTAEKNIYEVTDEAVDESITYMCYDYAEYQEVSRPSQTNDALQITMTASKDGEPLMEYTDEDAYSIYLGYEEYGAEFDEKLTGISAGETLSFSISYEEDFALADFAGSTIDYTVNVIRITEEVVPELTEEFITEVLGYDSQEALEASVRENLEHENEAASNDELQEALIQQVIENSEFESYSQELYDSYEASIEESYQNYAEAFGVDTTEEIYELFGMSQEDIAAEILNSVYRAIAVQAIAAQENLTLSEEAYQEGLARYTTDFEYESTDALIADYGEDSLRFWMQEELVLDYLQKHASITEVPAAMEEAEEPEET